MTLYLVGSLSGNLNQRKPVLLCLLPSVNQITVGNSLAVQCLGLHAFTAKGVASILHWELRSHNPRGQKQKQKQKINTD